MTKLGAIYGGRDPREAPIYTIGEVARYLHMPAATLRSWVKGRPYEVQEGPAFFEPLIRPADTELSRLSFTNLVEAHVLLGIRRIHKVPVKKVRTALDYAEHRLDIERLLIHDDLLAMPGNLFLERYGELVNLSQSGQLAMRRILAAYLQRIERDSDGLPERLYPFIDSISSGQATTVVIDPRISFGRPTVAEHGVSTSILAERIDSGERVEDLVRDYGLEDEQVEAAIVYERAA